MNVLMIGAHPDDCEFCAGGTAALLAAAGHRVKLLSVTNGDKGHHLLKPRGLARVRRAEAKAAASVLGTDWQVLDVPDCHVTPTVALREKLVGVIRAWKADVVISHRSNDYHPDHRNTGILVQDTAYLVMVPLFNPRVPPLRKNPIYLYFMDRFQSPEPFHADVVVPVREVFSRKVNALNSMTSQLHEWLPWVEGIEDEVPADAAARRAFTENFLRRHHEGAWKGRGAATRGSAARDATLVEAFQLCEYGRQPPLRELRAMFVGRVKT